MTANYLSITRLVLSVLAVTIVAERHILETAFFSQKCCKQKSFDANSSLSTKFKTNTRSALSESLSFFFFLATICFSSARFGIVRFGCNQNCTATHSGKSILSLKVFYS